MKRIRVIDTVAKALDHNTAVTLITTFGSTNDVMVFNASTNQLIATVRAEQGLYGSKVYSINNEAYVGLHELSTTLEQLPGFPRGASKSRNYSRPLLREGVVL